jgi:predicted permease
MSAIVDALVPVFLLIAFGFALRRARWPGEEFWPAAERFAYWVLFPALLFQSLATARLGGIDAERLALVIVASALAMTAIVVALRIVFEFEGPAFTSLLQGAVRFNTYLGIAIAFAAFGREGLTYAAIYLAIMVPVGNLISVLALAIWARPGGALRGAAVVLEVVRNPLIIACVLGIAVSLAGVPVPAPLARFLDIVAQGALPIGLMCVGAGIELSAAYGRRLAIPFACVLKLAVMPAVTYVLADALGLRGLAASVVVLFNALPAAPAAYVLARQMGGDAGLMAGILTTQVLLSAITLPAILAWLV